MTTSATAASLLETIRARRVRAGVIGLGYVGLPLAVEFARSGYTTTGIDLDATKVGIINEGRSYIDDVSSEDVGALRAKGLLRATTDFDVIKELDTINICVPTPLRKTKDPDLSFIVAAAEEISTRLRPGMLIILESTTYPGTTDELVLPILERSGLRGGKDFFLAFSPERIDPANPTFNTSNVPKVIGGMTPDCSTLAGALYGPAIGTVVPVSSTRVAEMVKLLENTFRAVNIGMVNELALMCDRLGIDVWEVVGAAATKPFGFMPFYPGPGLGGHCIPVDPFYLSWKARQSGFEARFIELAGAVNGAMPHHVVSLVSDALNAVRLPLNGSKVLLAGVAYKRDVDDIRESPALDLLGLLQERGATLAYSDPHVPKLAGKHWQNGIDLEHVDVSTASTGAYDCVVVVTDHSKFDYAEFQRVGKVVVDTRNAIKQPGPNVTRLGAARPLGAHEPAGVA
ncbi:MAG: nucleotide sugar dehydrogenase [Vicinamibacterales bacterium]